MAITVDTIETLLKARTGQYIKDMKAAEAAYDSWYRKVSGGVGDAGAAKAEQSAQRRTRARAKEVESEAQATARIGAMVDKSIAARNKEADAAERSADRIVRAGSRASAARQSQLLSGTSLSASPGQGPVSTVNYALRDQIDLQQKLNNAITIGDTAAVNGIQDQIRYIQLLNQYKRAGLDDTQAAVRAEQAVTDAVQARQAAETRLTNAGIAGTGRAANATRNLGRQFQDIGVGLVGGQGVFLVLAQQIPQVADALTDMTPKAGAAGLAIKALQFFATPTGAIILALASAVAIFGSQLIKTEESVGDLVNKLKEQDKETRKSELANKLFSATLEGVTKAADDAEKAVEALRLAKAGEAEQTAKNIKSNLDEADSLAARTRARLDDARAIARIAQSQAGSGGSSDEVVQSERDANRALDAVTALEQSLAKTEKQSERLRASLGRATAARIIADESASAEDKTNKAYDAKLDALAASGRTEAAIRKETRAINDARDAELSRIRAVEEAKRKAASSSTSGNYTTLSSPVTGGRVTSGIGARRAPIAGASTNHAGTDIAGLPIGTAVRAGANGVVISAGRLGALGNAVIVDYGGGTIAKYGHLESVLVSRGQRVARDEQIGTLGNTGRSTGAHLHYEVRTNGKVVNPNGRVRVGDQTAAEGRDLAQEQREAERAREEAKDNERQFQDEIGKINNRIAAAKTEEAVSLEQQAIYAQAAIERAQIDQDNDYQRQFEDGKINAAKRDFLIYLNAQASDAEKDKIQREAAIRIADRDLEIAGRMASLNQDALSAELILLTSRVDRYNAEKRLLELAQEEERSALERQIASGEITDATKARADLARKQGANGRSLDREYASPLQRYREEVAGVGNEINDALETVEVNGLQSLNDGIGEAITGAKSLGEAFSGVANQIISDLIRIAVQQAIIAPIAGLLGGGGGGGIFSAIGSLFGGGRAGGGPVAAGRVYKTNEYGTEAYASFREPGRIIPLGEMNTKGRGNTTIVQQSFTLDARGGITTPELLQYVNTTARGAAAQAGKAAYSGAVKAAPGATATARRFGNA